MPIFGVFWATIPAPCTLEMKHMPIILRTVLPVLLTAVFLAWPCAEPACGQPSLTGRFSHLSVGERPIVPAYSLAQDSLGFVWIGTDSGLYRHDGIRGQRFGWSADTPNCICNEHINVLDYDRASGRLSIGTDRGFCIYNNAGGFVQDTTVGPRHVKTALRLGQDVWIGTTDGLFLHSHGQTWAFLPGVHIASSCSVGSSLLFGSYGCVWKIDADGGSAAVRIDVGKAMQGNLVLALAEVPAYFGANGNEVFVGNERGLYRFNVSDAALKCLWGGGPVKNFLFLPDGSLAAGTDNGLLIVSPSGDIEVQRHEVGKSGSIPDNVVWATMLDGDGNLWVGTDHGVALTHLNEEYDFVGVERTGLSDGLDISSLICTGGHVYVAGMNGILDFAPSGRYSVFKSDRGAADRRLSHNKVRALYSDSQSVFAASDAGLDRIRDGRVTHWHITESSERFLSDWMYAVTEDSSGRLWTGTYDGGIFVISKSRLSERGGEVLCDRHISTADGLSGNIVLRLSAFGDRVVVVTDKGVDVIDSRTFEISHILVPDSRRTLSLASDGKRQWIGTEAGVYFLDGNELRPVSGASVSAQSLIFSDGFLWLSDGSEIWRCGIPDKPSEGCSYEASSCETVSRQWQLIRKFENPLFCLASDSGTVFAGSVNGFYSIPKSAAPLPSHPDRIVITALYLDNVLVVPDNEYSGRRILDSDIALTERITLGRNQNSFALTFSSMKYPASAGRFAWRLRGFHDEWQTGSADSRAVFLNVPPGDYSFEVCHLNPEGKPDSETKVLGIRILHPWYATAWAWLTYIALLAGTALFVAYFMKVRRQLQIERAEREKAQSIANSTISRTQEFRETLSAIFGSKGLDNPGTSADSGSISSDDASSGAPSPDSKFMKEISDIVYRHIDDPEFSAAALCEESHWPAKQVYRKIKQLTGLSTVEFIRDIRLSQAASLLEQGQLSITEIMCRVGFTTPSYFSKCFKARYGLTPSEYQLGRRKDFNARSN